MKTPLSNIEISRYEKTVKAAVNALLSSRSFYSYRNERDDLYQMAWIALIECMPKFNPKVGVKFETYATKVIQNAIIKEIIKISNKRMTSIDGVDFKANAINNDVHFMDMLIDIIENNLTKKEAKIFWARYFDNKSFEDIGRSIRTSKETARKIYLGSMKKLEKVMNVEN